MTGVDSVAGPIYSFLHYVTDPHLSCLILSSPFLPHVSHALGTTYWVCCSVILKVGASVLLRIYYFSRSHDTGYHLGVLALLSRASGILLFHSFVSSRIFDSFLLKHRRGVVYKDVLVW